MQKELDVFSFDCKIMGLTGGYELEKQSDTCTVLKHNGSPIAYVHDAVASQTFKTTNFYRYKEYITYLRTPVGIYVAKHLSEFEFLMALGIIAAANGRFLGIVQPESDNH
jgi:hypothetical protein